LRLESRFRGALYAVASALLVTGTAWLAVDRLKPSDLTETWQKREAYLLMLHGGAAMLMLLLLGAIIPMHAAVAWRRGRNRVTGSMMLASNAVLIVTAFALYYCGSEAWRHQASLLHIGFGLGLPALWALHVWRGKRTPTARAAVKNGPLSPEPGSAS
jgi:outer membrane biogenesis lipoprotein LolB